MNLTDNLYQYVINDTNTYKFTIFLVQLEIKCYISKIILYFVMLKNQHLQYATIYADKYFLFKIFYSKYIYTATDILYNLLELHV